VFFPLAILWLPAGVVASALFRGLGVPPQPQAFLSLLAVAPAGLPLAFACRRLHQKGYRITAWAAMAVLAAATVVATLVAGLLGPIAIVIYALLVSLPAWLAALLLRRRTR
jgi:Flp pilus assembly protein TadB